MGNYTTPALKILLSFRGQTSNNCGILTYWHWTQYWRSEGENGYYVTWLLFLFWFFFLIKVRCHFLFFEKKIFSSYKDRDLHLKQKHSVKYIILMLLFWLICSAICSILLFWAFNRGAGKSTHLHISTLPVFLL